MIHFTIITCTYNAESVLRRTLDSVRGQSWPCINHIIVDGKSTDHTVGLAQIYKADMEREGRGEHTVTIISEPDKGIYDAMNKGLRLAEPDYVLFLNAGDAFHDNDTLKNIVKSIDEALPEGASGSKGSCAPVGAQASKLGASGSREMLPGVIYGDTDVVDATNHYVGKRIHQPPEKLTWRSFQNGMLVCHQAFYVRTDIAQRNLYDMRYRLSGDIDWCIRVMKETQRMGLPLLNTHQVLCNFLAGGLSIRNHKESLHERFMIMIRHYGFWVTIFRHVQMTYNAFVKSKEKETTF